eukprot:6203780-Pleurochrysis_carterae.AAC.1
MPTSARRTFAAYFASCKSRVGSALYFAFHDAAPPQIHAAGSMSSTADSPTAASSRAARAKLEKYAYALLTSRGLSHWKFVL